MSKHELLFGDMKMMAMKNEEYHTIPEQMSTFGVLQLFLLIIISLWLLFERSTQILQGYQADAD